MGPKKAQEYDSLVKLLLLGDSAVGKSSLLLRYCEDKFHASHILTIGVDFKTKVVDVKGEKVKLQIWDTAGQERFRNITPVYFRSANGIIFVYDVTKPETFKNIRFWMKNLEEFTDKDILKVLIGNKTDLGPKRQVTTQMGKKLAQEYGIPFFETSAKLNENVEAAFLTTAEMIRTTQVDPQEGRNIVRGMSLSLNGGEEFLTAEQAAKWNTSGCCAK